MEQWPVPLLYDCKILIEKNYIDRSYIAEHTEKFEELKEFIKAYPLADGIKKTGLSQEQKITISGLYFAGQRIMSPGGMPAALVTGRQAVHLLCRDNNMVFDC